MNLEDLIGTWESIARPTWGRMMGRRAAQSPVGIEIWVAVDHDAFWHLLVTQPEGADLVSWRSTKGLDVRTEQLQISEEPLRTYIDLVCLSADFKRTFAAVSVDIIKTVLEGSSSPGDSIIQTLRYWKRFWSVGPQPLTEEAALGLFGELWFLERWMGIPSGVASWVGPTGARHDFQGELFSVEVKTARGGAGSRAVHRIAGIDQLDNPEMGDLFLFSLQVVEDPLSMNTLPGLVERVLAMLSADINERFVFLDRLGESGYNPAEAFVYTTRWRIVAEEIYRVNGDFPRLTRSSFPSGLPYGVSNVNYSLALDACGDWLLAKSPYDPSAEFLRQ
jgi:hypothetical protein